MGRPVRSKKMAVRCLLGVAALTGHIQRKMVRIETMADRILRLDRRELIAGLGAALLGPAVSPTAAAQERPSLPLQANAGALALPSDDPDTPLWFILGRTQ